MAGLGCHLRLFATSMGLSADKYQKILKYTRPVDDKIYKEGDESPARPFPAKKIAYPVYKYETMFFKRQNRGLYGGLQRSSSKNVSEAGNRTNRAHLPNIVKSKLWSETLNKQISTHVSTRVLRTITKEGGLDNYLLKDKPARVKTMGLKGWKLRYEIMKKRELEERSAGLEHTIYHVSDSGKRITVGRKKLLRSLYPYVYNDNYAPVEWNAFLKQHLVLTAEELVQKLEAYGHDFSEITA